MKTENNHKKDYRKKIEDQLTNLVEAHLSGINKNAASKLSKTIGSAVKQIAKKFYKTHFSIESEKNEEIISKIIKAKSIKKTTTSGKVKSNKVSKTKPKAIKAKSVKPVVKKAAVAKAKPSAKKTTSAKAKPAVKKTVKATVKKVAKPIAAAKKLSSIPKEFMGSISKKTAKK